MAAAVTTLAVASRVPVAGTVQIGLAVAGMLFVAAALVDVHQRRLPNRLLLAAWVAAVLPGIAVLDAPLVGRVVGGALLGGGLVLFVRLRRGIGMGDVKMAAAVGASLANVAVAAGPLAIAVAAALAAAWGLLFRRPSLPLGPALWLGWATALVLSTAGWWR